MLAPLRRQLRRIHYYSAARPLTPWARAADRILVLALVAALPVTALCNVTIDRLHVIAERNGMFLRTDEGETVAAIMESEAPVGGWPSASLGRFTLRTIEMRRGWPFITSTLRPPASLEYDMFHEEERRIDRGRSVDAPLRHAVLGALQVRGEVDMLESWLRETPQVASAPPLRWIFSSVAWWFLLYAAGMGLLGVTRGGAFLFERAHSRRERRWKRQGCCTHCGYNLRGAEFSERCPECGVLAE